MKIFNEPICLEEAKNLETLLDDCFAKGELLYRSKRYTNFKKQFNQKQWNRVWATMQSL